MQIDSGSGLIQGVRFVASPNCDDRPAGVAVDTLVIHSISLPPGKFGGPGVEQLFCNSLENLPFEDAQYEALRGVTDLIRKQYPAITRERIYGHGDIAPGRKTDPGSTFDWKRFLAVCS